MLIGYYHTIKYIGPKRPSSNTGSLMEAFPCVEDGKEQYVVFDN